jgi:hypothetical protein
MDHIKVLKRAFNITWAYRALWVFGIILALTTGGQRGGNGPQATFNGNGKPPSPPQEFPMPPEEFPTPPFLEDFELPEITPVITGTLIAIGCGLACVVVLLIVVSIVARYVSETALIRLVDDYEETGEKRSVREGFRLGWSRTAWRLFLIDLVIGLPLFLVFMLVLALTGALVALSVWVMNAHSVPAGVIGIVVAVGFFFPFLLLFIVVVIACQLLMPFFKRAGALEELGVLDSIRHGFDFVKRHWQDAGVMWLLMIGLGLAFVIAMIPILILMVLAGVMIGGLPALTIGGLGSLAFGGAGPWIVAAVVGLLIFLLVVAAPSLFLGGLAEVYKSSVWTLTYRELRALEGLAPLDAPATA